MEVLKFSPGVIKSKTWVITAKKASPFYLKHLQKSTKISCLQTELKCEELTITALPISLFSFLELDFLPCYGLFLGLVYKISDRDAFIYQKSTIYYNFLDAWKDRY